MAGGVALAELSVQDDDEELHPRTFRVFVHKGRQGDSSGSGGIPGRVEPRESGSLVKIRGLLIRGAVPTAHHASKAAHSVQRILLNTVTLLPDAPLAPRQGLLCARETGGPGTVAGVVWRQVVRVEEPERR